MSLRILSSPPPEPADVARDLSRAISAALPGAQVSVQIGSPGHFELAVASKEFAGLSRVQQQQRVYAAIRHLMAGDAAPVHAIDRMTTRVP